MQVQKVSFTSAQPKEQKESALYSKRGYMNQVRYSQFLGGFLATYGILETIDKFVLTGKTDVTKEALKKTAKSHTKYNFLCGLAAGVASMLVGKFFTDKYTIPFAERQWDKLEKYEEINNKTKELIKEVKEVGQEKAQLSETKEHTSETKVENKEKSEAEIKKTEDKTSDKKPEEKKEDNEQKDSKKDA